MTIEVEDTRTEGFQEARRSPVDTLDQPKAESKAEPASPPDEPPPPIAGKRRAIALLVVLLGLLLDLLDVVIVNIALPSMQASIGADASAVQWMVAAYTLSFAVLLVTSGRLGDLVGRKRMFLIGLAGFTLASLVAGVAQSPGQIIGARIVQGVMAAAMVPQVLAIIQVMYRPHERGRAFAGLSVVFALGTVGGPIFGALLTSSNVAGWGWRTIFLINVPLGVLAFVLAAHLIPESKGETARKLDIPAVVLVTLALVLLVFPLVQGRELGWPAWTVASLFASLVVFAVLIAHERRRRESPLIPLTLFRHRSLSGGLLVSVFFMAGVMPYFLINTLYLQIGLGYSVLLAGFTGVLWGFAPPLFTNLSARYITPRIGRLGLQLGLVLMMVGMVLIMLAVRYVDDVSPWHLAPGMALGGTGMGLTFAPLLTYTLNDVPVDEAGAGSGLFNTVQQVGTALGVAACGLVFFGLLSANAPDAAQQTVPRLRADLVAAGAPEATADRLAGEFRRCFVDGMKSAEAACVTPATTDGGRYTEVVSRHAREATGADYRDTMQLAPLYQITMFTVALIASFWLPRRV